MIILVYKRSRTCDRAAKEIMEPNCRKEYCKKCTGKLVYYITIFLVSGRMPSFGKDESMRFQKMKRRFRGTVTFQP